MEKCVSCKLLRTFVKVYFLLFQMFQFRECLCSESVFGATSKKGQHFNSGEMRGGKMGNKKNCQQHKMAVVIRLSPGLRRYWSSP